MTLKEPGDAEVQPDGTESPSSAQGAASSDNPKEKPKESTFRLDRRGVWLVSEGADDVLIGGPIKLAARARTVDGKDWVRLFEYRDHDGVRHVRAIPERDMIGDPAILLKALSDDGLFVPASRKLQGILHGYLATRDTKLRKRLVDKLGWHEGAYVLADACIGSPEEELTFQGASSPDGRGTSGTAESWRENVAALAAGNTRVVFAISTMFAGPVLDIVGLEGGGFHFRGSSSIGKSTLLKIAASVAGSPKYMRSWRITANALESTAAQHNDATLLLDEIGQCDPRQVGGAAYLLANGFGKGRSERSGQAKAIRTFKALFLSTGETSLSALVATAGERTHTGQELRIAEIDADAGAGFGVLEELHGRSDSAALADELVRAAAVHFGAVNFEWLHLLVSSREKYASALIDDAAIWSREFCGTNQSPQVMRVAKRFALVAAAGELATEFGLTGWQRGEATRAAKACFDSWLAGFYAGAAQKEDERIITQVREFFERFGGSRFQAKKASADDRVIPNRAGFYEEFGDVRTYYLLPSAFKEMSAGYDRRDVERVLLEQGWLVRGGDGRSTQKPRLPEIGNSTRVHVIRLPQGGEE